MHASGHVALSAALLLTAVACADRVTTDPETQAEPPVTFSHDPAGPTDLDQSQPVADGLAPFTFAIGGQSSQVLAQVFTAGVSGRLRAIELPVGCDGGRLRIEIRDAPTGTPGTVGLATEVFGAGELPAGFPPGGVIFTTLPLRPAPAVTAGAAYAVVLSNPDSPAESCGMLPGPEGDSYAGGNGYFFDTDTSSWVNISLGNGREDLPFFTYVQP